MDLVASKSAPDHTSLTHPDPPTTTAIPTTIQKHTSQAMNSADVISGTTPSSMERPSSLAKMDASPYQLVFGIDETSSETSLTGDSPLVHDPSGQVSPHISLSQQSNSESVDGHSNLHTSSNAPPSVSSGNEVASSAVTAGVSTAAVMDSAGSAPIRGEVAGISLPDSALQNGNDSGNITNPPEESLESPETSVKLATDLKSALSEEVVRMKPHPLTNDSGVGGTPSPPPDIASSGEVGGKKTHPLSFLTSDSEVGGTPTPPPGRAYSPIPNTSGDEDEISEEPRLSPTSPTDSTSSEDAPVMSILFSGIIYLGSSSVDAPISEIEANRKMHVLREQAEGTEPMPIILSVPLTNHGSVILKDPKTDQPMATLR